jgi:hypothetical protein
MPSDSMVAYILAIRHDPTRSSVELAAAVRRVEQFARDAAQLGATRWASPPPGTAVRTAVLMFLLTLAGLVLVTLARW